MAKKHKAPTEVTIIQEEKSPFARWIDSNWKMMTFAAIGLIAIILGSQIRAKNAVAGRDADLDTMLEAVVSGDPGQLAQASEQLAGSSLAGWTNLAAVQLAFIEDRPADAAKLLADMEGDVPPLLELSMPLGPEGEESTVLEHLTA